MAGINYILDTNIIIGFLKGDGAIINQIQNTGMLFLPNFVVAELYYGALKSQKQTENLSKIQNLLTAYNIIVLYPDLVTSMEYAKIKQQLVSSGNIIPENDMWIAAFSIQHNIPLVSRDSDFQRIGNLNLVIW